MERAIGTLFLTSAINDVCCTLHIQLILTILNFCCLHYFVARVCKRGRQPRSAMCNKAKTVVMQTLLLIYCRVMMNKDNPAQFYLKQSQAFVWSNSLQIRTSLAGIQTQGLLTGNRVKSYGHCEFGDHRNLDFDENFNLQLKLFELLNTSRVLYEPADSLACPHSSCILKNQILFVINHN